MKKLTPYQLATLYLILFNLSEGSYGAEHITPVNELLNFNGEPDFTKWIPDEDGGPINASTEVYQTFNEEILSNDKLDIDWYLDSKQPSTELILQNL